MWLNLLALAVLAVFAAMGARRGALTTGLGLVTLILSYVAAIVLGPPLAPHLEETLAWNGVFALAGASSLAFAGTFVVLGLASRVLRHATDVENDSRSPRDRFLGASFGAVRGALVALLLVYFSLWLDTLRDAGLAPWMPEVGESAAGEITSQLVETGVQAALGDTPAGRVASRVAARPAVAMGELRSVIDDPEVMALRDDEMFWTYVEHGSIDTALNRGSFARVAQDDEVRGRLAMLGLVPPEAETNPAVFRAAVAEVLHEVSTRIRGLRNDPELQALLEDPQVVAMLQNGDTLGLLSHPGFRSLVDRVASD